MELTGRVKDTSMDWKTQRFNILLEVNENDTFVNGIDELANCEKLSITIDKYREKRSLDANAYCWVLIQKIAEAVHSDKWSVYLRCLQDYSRRFTHIIVKENAVEEMKKLCRTCVDLGEVTVNGQTGHQLQVYYGSSTFDTKDMSVFLEGIISECKEMGIETKSPDEIRRMEAAWQNY